MFGRLLVLLALTFVLVSCGEKPLVESAVPREDLEFSKELVSLLRAKNFQAVEERLDPNIRKQDVSASLEKMYEAFPVGDPEKVEVISYQWFRMKSVRGVETKRATLRFQYQFPDAWMLVEVVVNEGDKTAEHFSAYRLPDSLANINKFTFSHKSALHYAIFALSIAIPIFIAGCIVVCLRTRAMKRKWLWILFMLFGVGGFSLNWTTGQWGIKLLNVYLFGAGWNQDVLYGPLIFTVSVPLGAILFLLRRNDLALIQKPAE
jgi:hypothetical protein